MFDEGRFGPVYRSQDPETQQPVLIRTFAQPLTADEQERFVHALTRLCESPLDHPSIARPLAAGIEEGRPFLIHTLLPGTSLQRFLEEHGPQPFSEVVLRVTQLAAAIDFAAAAGVHHGDLGHRDVIVGRDSTGISGFGVVQALHEAGIGLGAIPDQADDIRALARVAFEFLTGRPLARTTELEHLVVPGADGARLRAALAAAADDRPEARPASALAFAASLQDATAGSDSDRAASGTVVGATPDPRPVMTVDDLPLRPDARPAFPSVADVPIEPALRPEPALRADPGLAMRPGPPASAAPQPAGRAGQAAVLPLGPGAAAHDAEPRSGWFLVAAALAVGILAGFTGGFIVGQRSDVPIPRFAADLIEGAAPPAARATPAPAQGSALGTRDSGEAGRAPASGVGAVAGVPDSARVIEEPGITSRELDAGEPVDRGGAAPDRSAGAPATAAQAADADGEAPRASTEVQMPAAGAANAGEQTRSPAAQASTPAAPSNPVPAVPSPATPGGLQVLSRPEGAQVYVDGALVGRTPLVIPSVGVGIHDVRMELDGHRPWATRVRVEPGARARVAASLEQ